MFHYLIILTILLIYYFVEQKNTYRKYLSREYFSQGIVKFGGRIQPYLGKGFYRPANVPLKPFVSKYKKTRASYFKPNFLCYDMERLTKTRDQGLCGSCWAFSITSLLGDRIAIYTNGNNILNLSVQQILSCFGKEKGCEGESPEDILLELQKQQTLLIEEKHSKYSQLIDTNIKTKCVGYNKYRGINVKPNSVHSLAMFIDENKPDKKKLKYNIINIKNELLKNGPVFAVMTIYDDFYEYDGRSVYKHDKNLTPTGGHAVEIIGYSDEGVDFRKEIKGEPYWICRNSWGSKWPVNSTTNGIFAIKMGTNECGIESRVGCAEPDGYDENINTRLYSMKFTSFNSFLNNPYKKDFFI